MTNESVKPSGRAESAFSAGAVRVGSEVCSARLRSSWSTITPHNPTKALHRIAKAGESLQGRLGRQRKAWPPRGANLGIDSIRLPIIAADWSLSEETGNESDRLLVDPGAGRLHNRHAMRLLNYAGYIAFPFVFVVHYWLGHGKSWEPTVTFMMAALSVIPLAHLMGTATEHLSERTGPTWGGLLNATFGNAAELIIAIVAMTKGLNQVVKASLTGSILGNLLLVSGAAMIVGGWKREKQTFSRAAAEANSGLLAVAVTAMLFPAIFHFSYQWRDPSLAEHEHSVSIGTSIILLVVYALGLIFTLRTHSHIFSRGPAYTPEDPAGLSGTEPAWSVRKSAIALLLASVGIGIVSEYLVGAVEPMAERFGWNKLFVGVIVLAIIGNAAEHSTAVVLAKRNDMDTAMTITYQSSLQIALFAVPVLVLLNALLMAMGVGGVKQLDLLFTPMEVVAVILTVGIVVVIGFNGETNWFEGAMLLAVYAILAIGFFYIPDGEHGGYDGQAGGVGPPPVVAPHREPAAPG